MAQRGGSSPIIPSGYETDGLVFFLDGKQLASASKWTDIVGGKEFTLTNCSKAANGIIFGSDSYGLCTGAITNNATNETVELVFVSTKTAKTNQYMLSQPKINNATGIQGAIGSKWSNGNQLSVSWHADGNNHMSYIFTDIAQLTLDALHCLSIKDGATVYDGTELTQTYQTYYGANSTGNTCIGARYNGATMNSHFEGTLCAVRIYSKKLTVSTIKANQAIDAVRYALS